MEMYTIYFSTSAFLISESSSALRRLFLAFLSLDQFGVPGVNRHGASSGFKGIILVDWFEQWSVCLGIVFYLWWWGRLVEGGGRDEGRDWRWT